MEMELFHLIESKCLDKVKMKYWNIWNSLFHEKNWHFAFTKWLEMIPILKSWNFLQDRNSEFQPSPNGRSLILSFQRGYEMLAHIRLTYINFLRVKLIFTQELIPADASHLLAHKNNHCTCSYRNRNKKPC